MEESYIDSQHLHDYLIHRIRKSLPCVQLTQGILNLCWLIVFWATVPFIDDRTCYGPVYLFSKISQVIHIFLAGWNLLSIPISYQLAKKARRETNPENRRPPRWLFSIWRVYHFISFSLWLYALTALLSLRSCWNNVLSAITVSFVVLPVVLAIIWICTVGCCSNSQAGYEPGASYTRPDGHAYEMVEQTV